jgi:hypothetical protein
VGIVDSETASSPQLKGTKAIVAGIVDSEMGTEDSEDSEMVGNDGSVCVDIDTEEEREIEGGFD